MTVDNIKITRGDYNTPIGQLYLRPGRYRLTVSDEEGHRIGGTTITVARSPDGPAELTSLPHDASDGACRDAPCPSTPAVQP